MSNERLSDRAKQRVSGQSWDDLRQVFFAASNVLLGVCPTAVGVLTTIYVKYQVDASPDSAVFAVIWLKSSSQIVVGMALTSGTASPHLVKAPKSLSYKGLSGYLVLGPGSELPGEFAAWAQEAYLNATAQSR